MNVEMYDRNLGEEGGLTNDDLSSFEYQLGVQFEEYYVILPSIWGIFGRLKNDHVMPLFFSLFPKIPAQAEIP